jgi:hypothetical protein
MKYHQYGLSVTCLILWTCPPTFLPFRTIKLGFTKPAVDIIMGITQPATKVSTAVDLWCNAGNVGLEVLRAYPAWVYTGKESYKVAKV